MLERNEAGTVVATNLGFPRIGAHRELKKALESHWAGQLSAPALEQVGRSLRERHWSAMKAAGISHVPTNDFSFYDHVLDAAVMFGAVPERYAAIADPFARTFAMARGLQDGGVDVPALEMTKWFDTNYHYIVPELAVGQTFALEATRLLAEVAEARALGVDPRPVLLGPVTFLRLSKLAAGAPSTASPLDLLPALISCYDQVLGLLHDHGVGWVQLDEPALALDLDARTREAFRWALRHLSALPRRPRLLLATYFGDLGDNLDLALHAGCEAVHLRALADAASGEADPATDPRFVAARAAQAERARSPRTRHPAVRARMAAVVPALLRRRSSYQARAVAQRERFALPPLPTTTIGSFPQTRQVREARAAWRAGRLGEDAYHDFLKEETRRCVIEQEEIGLDVLVHGEFERTDMAEYFGEQLDGFAFTESGWVQSYGSRCVKPPIIFGDVARPRPMTVAWTRFAQSLTKKPMKGMLTGPVTILQWSFVRDDQPRADTCMQLALALRDEVADLEAAGVGMIQVDEPAIREGLPLRRADHAAYLQWTVDAFRLATAGVRNDTQIHTHMCYAEFGDILDAVAALDADVLSIETSRSKMELFADFGRTQYPNEVGPGVYDIHSPRVPTGAEMDELLARAARVLPRDRLWVNPDCGLKTRGWPEVRAALANMVASARRARLTLGAC